MNNHRIHHRNELNLWEDSIVQYLTLTDRIVEDLMLKSKIQRKKDESQDIVVVPEPKYNFNREDLIGGRARWVVPRGKTLILVVKFFTKTTG